ncbi:MAG: hypothetical protein R3F08_00610 [Dokdonella sp.]
MRLHRTLAPALLLVLASPGALALRLDYTVELGYLHSDNINLSATDPVDENLLIPRVGFRLSETGSAVRAEVNGLLEYRDYLGGAFGNEFRSTLDGIVDWTLIPERMKWTFTDALGLNPINLRLPDTPGNLQQTNVFATGPTFQFRLASNVTGLAELRYTDSYAEESSDFNSNRFSGALRGLFELDSTRRLSANIEAADINYDSNSAQSDYKRYAGYAGYVQKLSALELDAALGYSYLDFDNGERARGPLARLKLDWRASAQSSFGLSVFREFSDAATTLAAGNAAFAGGLGGVTIGGATISPEVYKDTRVELRYALNTARISLGTAVFAGTIRYEQSGATDSDRDEHGARIDLGFNLRPNLTLGVLAETTRRDYRTGAVDTRDSLYGAYLRQQMSRHWGWRIDLNRSERHSDGDDLSYDENTAYVRVIYTR